MSVVLASPLSPFALDVAEGLSDRVQKRLSPAYLYDDLGSVLFDAITLLPEYGVTRADERLLRGLAKELSTRIAPISVVAELGSGNGKKTRHILQALQDRVTYCPIDVSAAALRACERELESVAEVRPIRADWVDGLTHAMTYRASVDPMLLLFLGSSIGNLDRQEMAEFLKQVRSVLREGDYFLVGADLVKPVHTMLMAYDDPTGVTAAFNRNVLGRINRELDGDFDLRSFTHEARWNAADKRIEMHLVSSRHQSVKVGVLDSTFSFAAGESIWTESSHKFTEHELDSYAFDTGFHPVRTWVDAEWPFAETLWQAEAPRY